MTTYHPPRQTTAPSSSYRSSVAIPSGDCGFSELVLGVWRIMPKSNIDREMLRKIKVYLRVHYNVLCITVHVWVLYFYIDNQRLSSSHSFFHLRDVLSNFRLYYKIHCNKLGSPGHLKASSQGQQRKWPTKRKYDAKSRCHHRPHRQNLHHQEEDLEREYQFRHQEEQCKECRARMPRTEHILQPRSRL